MSATTQPIAMPIEMSAVALSWPATVGSRQVVDTAALAAAHRPIPTKNSRPSRRPNAPTIRASVRTARMPSVAIPSSACDGTEGRAGTSEPHGPGPR